MPSQPRPTLPRELLDLEQLRSAFAAGTPIIPLYREALERASHWLDGEFAKGRYIRDLITLRAQLVDALVSLLWEQQAWPGDGACLVAVGGYGRGELHPHSDIDLLILLDGDDRSLYHNAIGNFITHLWDMNLHIGHSVRDLAECCSEAARDITIATNLMESRPLTGNRQLHANLMGRVGPPRIWPSPDFFRAKWDEQLARHRKYGNTEYSLEPNVKSSPGGLRDIQMVGWVAKRHFGASHLQELLERGFLTHDEFELLNRGQDFLWRVRYALHMVTGREEDRLLFDHQRTLAKMFGFEDDDARLAVERFMQRYYRWVLALGELNEMLMQHFDEAIVRACEPEMVMELNPRFRVRNGYIEVSNDKVFEKTPSALMEIFVLMANHSHIHGVRATTIRQIRKYRDLIDDEFRADPRNSRYFIELLRSTHKMAAQLERMKRYGVLGNYLPEFGQIIGQMQHDLFHIYTVDAHTLEVIKNMRRFLLPEAAQEFPMAARVVRRLPKVELLYIAGLYHDIGKGRGGDHSVLGARDAIRFCERHGINRRETNLVVWLVKKHLLMSTVSQRQDISDPDVIHKFALKVGDQPHLDYLYALTVADIRATNPTLWNSWRASLLSQLYMETKRALRRGLENPIDKQEWIEESQEMSISQLEGLGFAEDEVRTLWANTGDDYFMREKSEDIVWHTQAIAQHAASEEPLVLVKPSLTLDRDGATQIFVRSRERDNLFAVLAAGMEQLDLSVQDARLYNSGTGYILYTFFVLDVDGESIGDDAGRLDHIRNFLLEQLGHAELFPDIMRKRTPRQMRLFSTPTETSVFRHSSKNQTVLEVITPDRPGLLARIGRIFVDFRIQLQNAKITTLGERVEDVFFITDTHQQPIENAALLSAIQAAIRKELDEKAAA